MFSKVWKLYELYNYIYSQTSKWFTSKKMGKYTPKYITSMRPWIRKQKSFPDRCSSQ